MTDPVVPVILSGGAGTRLWPVSRASLPKPFLRLPDGETLAEKTLLRAARLGGPRALTVTGVRHAGLNRDAERCLDPDALDMHYLLEPVARNTAPAVAAAALLVAERWGSDSVMLVMPADHLIGDLDAFEAAVGQASQLARRGYLATFGIRPEAPETGFGYIRRGARIDGAGFEVARFEEKPDAETAARYLADGSYDWNAGIFCFTAGSILEELAEHAPGVLRATEACWSATDGRAARTVALDADRFGAVPSISIDYAVMEHSRRAAVVPCRIGWSDVGSWTAISALIDPDERGNRSAGDTLMIDSRDCFVQSDGRLVATLGVCDLVVIDTPDALLVARREAVQSVRRIVDRLREDGHPAADCAPAAGQTRRLALGSEQTAPPAGGREVIVVLEGRLRAGDRDLGPGDTLRIEADQRLSVRALEASQILRVTLPEPGT